MTADGFKVYEGNGYGAATRADFVASRAPAGVSKEERATLAAMERASVRFAAARRARGRRRASARQCDGRQRLAGAREVNGGSQSDP